MLYPQTQLTFSVLRLHILFALSIACIGSSKTIQSFEIDWFDLTILYNVISFKQCRNLEFQVSFVNIRLSY